MSIWKKVVLLCFLCVIAIFAIKVHHVRVEQGKYQMTRIDEANRYLQEGNHLLKDGNIDGAIKNYRMALEVQPNWDIALDNIKAADRLIT